MRVIDYDTSDRKKYWLEQIGKSDWGAGKFLYELISKNTFKETVGESSKVLMLVDGDELISFCTYAEKDDIQPTELTPWIGFVYTFPKLKSLPVPTKCRIYLYQQTIPVCMKNTAVNFIG